MKKTESARLFSCTIWLATAISGPSPINTSLLSVPPKKVMNINGVIPNGPDKEVGKYRAQFFTVVEDGLDPRMNPGLDTPCHVENKLPESVRWVTQLYAPALVMQKEDMGAYVPVNDTDLLNKYIDEGFLPTGKVVALATADTADMANYIQGLMGGSPEKLLDDLDGDIARFVNTTMRGATRVASTPDGDIYAAFLPPVEHKGRILPGREVAFKLQISNQNGNPVITSVKAPRQEYSQWPMPK